MDSASTSPTFASALDAAMRKRRMTLTELRDRLVDSGHPVSLASLSYWRAGHREPARRQSLDAVPEIERLLGLPANTLSIRLPLATRSAAPAAFDELIGAPAPEHIKGEADIDRILFHVVVDIGAERQVLGARVTQVFVARREGVDGITIFVGPDSDDSGTNDISLKPVSGCSIGHAWDAARGIRATRLMFERPLSRGESVATEYTATVDGRLDLETEYGLVAEQRIEEAMVWIRFDPTCLPARAWVWFEEDGLRHDWPVDLQSATGVHYRQTAFGPGALAARWEW